MVSQRSGVLHAVHVQPDSRTPGSVGALRAPPRQLRRGRKGRAPGGTAVATPPIAVRVPRAVSAPARAPTRKTRRLHVLVSAGPTREHVDPVRYLTNESSGRMGFEIAAAAAQAGHKVTLVAGPVALATPKGVVRIDVVSARDMLAALKGAWRSADALYMAAAVADWRPAKRLAGKWRAKDGGATTTALDLVRNPDILATLTGGRRDPRRTVVAFALETGDGVRRARAKLVRKGADWIVLNSPAALKAERTSVRILSAADLEFALTDQPKRAVARRLVELLDLQD
ncbi:MAG: phosphopantothenoylcysteine decarboxylase [Planctomycetes bacterium]|nr:phosphopantothenoylcysteine decarboxylase [Planctomycetota bacterium]